MKNIFNYILVYLILDFILNWFYFNQIKTVLWWETGSLYPGPGHVFAGGTLLHTIGKQD